MIAFHSVSKEIGRGRFRKLVLFDLNFAVPRQIRLAILGHRGSGKTTLMRLMIGTSRPTSGWVERHGLVARNTFGYVSEALTPKQIVARVARTHRMDPKELVDFVANFGRLHKVMNLPLSHLPAPIRTRVNRSLYYAIPFDYYILDDYEWHQRRRRRRLSRGTEFSERCAHAFNERVRDAGLIVSTKSVSTARTIGGMGGVLVNGHLMLYNEVEDAFAYFLTLPKAHEEKIESPQEQEGLLETEEDDI